MAIIGVNAKVEVSSTTGSALPSITGITLANPGVVTSTAHGLSNGDVVIFTVPGGMVELDGQGARVAGITANTFQIEGLDTTNYSTWTAGTGQKITAFSTLSSARSVTMPNPTPNKLETTVLTDIAKQYAYGLPDAPDGSITALFNPGGTAEGLITAATRSNGALVFRLSFSGNTKHSVFNANVSGGQGFSMSQNAVAEATISFTPIKQVLHYGT